MDAWTRRADRLRSRTDPLAAFLRERLAEHDVLAGATAAPWLERADLIPLRWALRGYRTAIAHLDDAGTAATRARHYASAAWSAAALRRHARRYRQHGSYNPTWR